MSLRKLLSILIVSLMFLSMSQVFGQGLTMGEKPQEDIKVTIDENGTAHDVHYVKGNSIAAVQVNTIKGNMTNFSARDTGENSVQYFTVGKNAVMFPPTSRNVTLIKYDLPNIVSLSDGIWKWKYYTPSDATFTDFYFPKGVDMIWANNTPAYLGEHGIRQHGNGMALEYIINEPVISQNVQWADKNFTVGIRTLSGVGQYAFDQSAKAYAFDINKANIHVTVIMPLELLWGPYEVKLNGNGTLYKVSHNNGTHVWIGLTPHKAGTVQITGTTAIPEFPLFVPLVIGISVVIALQFRNRLNFN
jgi:hypothetical protein